MLVSEFDIGSFRENLQDIRFAIQQSLKENPDCPDEVDELMRALGRLENELEKKKSRQMLADFLLVMSVMSAVSQNEDDDEDDFDDEDDEDEDDYDDNDDFDDDFEEEDEEE
jgi:hypothetical protein